MPALKRRCRFKNANQVFVRDLSWRHIRKGALPPTFCCDLGEEIVSEKKWRAREKQKKLEGVLTDWTIQGCCLVVYNASGRAFIVNLLEVSVSTPSSRHPWIHKCLRSKCMSIMAFGSEGDACFVIGDTLVRSESNVVLAFAASG